MYETKTVDASGSIEPGERVHPDDVEMIEEMAQHGWERYSTSVKGNGQVVYKMRRSARYEPDVSNQTAPAEQIDEAAPDLNTKNEGESMTSESETADSP